ncbi:MAG TPA: SusD/RagB family nutrient-binding outer membrane lipoprotein [Bacteroidales bacterium]|nr:SusD/RagB family nutrient-binding outer membrane lipoprotein [Bacteroidales bacterium]
MKKLFFKTIPTAAAVIIIMIMASCEKNSLTDLNKNPNQIEYVIPEYSFTAAVLESYPVLSYAALSQGLQYFSTYKEVPAVGDKFYNFNGTAGVFDIYNNQMNRLLQLTSQIPGDENVNKRAACEILRILAFHRVTDMMGDLPYTEAMKGNTVLKPKYDTQKSIYLAMLSELDAALTSMDVNKPNVFGTADPYFKGSVAKWKKFGYTLMMRLGMRMSDVEPALAKSWVEKAAAGGIMTDFADIAYIKFANITGQMNPRVTSMINGDFASPGGDNVEGGKWSATFINHLKNTKDPRLQVLSVVWVPSGGTYTADNNPDHQKGMVSGSINTKPTDFDTYSEPSLLYIDRGSPIVTMEPAEAYLLLAEAALRGWNVGITAETAYNNAVSAAMARWALWPTVAPHSGVISATAVSDYLTLNPYLSAGTFDQQLEQISTQKWISMLGNEYEIWSNWRRTKYPVFNYANWTGTSGDKISYPGNVTAGKMWRRFSLPIAERNVNPDNYYEAISRQNFTEETVDLLQGRMWWDVGPKTGQSNVN